MKKGMKKKTKGWRWVWMSAVAVVVIGLLVWGFRPQPITVEYARPAPEHMVLRLDAGTEPATVFVSEGHHPWWRATVDGKPAPIVRAQMAFMAVPVGAGPHVIEMRFRPPPVVVAADTATTFAWMALGPAAVALGIRRWRRHRADRRTGPASTTARAVGAR